MGTPASDLKTAEKRLVALDDTAAAAHVNVETMERMIEELKAKGDATALAEDLLTSYRGEVVRCEKALSNAQENYETMKAKLEEPAEPQSPASNPN